MPLPQPRKGETKNDFVKRFVTSDVAKREFPDVKQRIAVALNIWRRSKKKSKNSDSSSYQNIVSSNGRISGVDYVVIQSVPVMDEHYIVKCNHCNGRGDGCPNCRNGVIDLSVEDFESSPVDYEVVLYVNSDVLQRIADKMNKRAAATNDFAAITIGHTSPDLPEIEQPPVIGHAKNFSVKPIRESHNRSIYALVCDFYILKDYEDALLRFPRKSVEYNIQDDIVDPIALLGASSPARQVGWIAFTDGNKPRIMRYSAMQDSTGLEALYNRLLEEVSSIKNEMQSYKDRLCKMEQEYAKYAEFMKKYEEEIQSYAESADSSTLNQSDGEAMQNVAMPGPTNVMVPTFEQYQQMKEELATLKQKYSMLQRKYLLEELKSKHGIELSVDEELQFTKDMSDEMFNKYVEHSIKRRYARRPSMPENTPFISTAMEDTSQQQLDDSKIEIQDKIAKYALRNNITYMEAKSKLMEMLKSGHTI